MTYKKNRNETEEFLRLKPAMTRFGFGEDKLQELAKECGALYKVDRCVLIHYETFKKYMETFKVV